MSAYGRFGPDSVAKVFLGHRTQILRVAGAAARKLCGGSHQHTRDFGGELSTGKGDLAMAIRQDVAGKMSGPVGVSLALRGCFKVM